MDPLVSCPFKTRYSLHMIYWYIAYRQAYALLSYLPISSNYVLELGVFLPKYLALHTRTTPKPHLDELLIEDGPEKWALKIEYLLESDIGRTMFADYLRQTFCEENVIFWSEVKELNELPENQVAETLMWWFSVWTHMCCNGRGFLQDLLAARAE